MPEDTKKELSEIVIGVAILYIAVGFIYSIFVVGFSLGVLTVLASLSK